MANINVAEWTPDEVANWLEGLQEPVGLYIPVLKERGLDGKRLLILRCDDLEYLGVTIIGHQEIILEAVEQLRNFHYETKRECVQQLALRVSVVGSSLARSLALQQDARLDTQSLAEVARLVRAVKPLAWWLERCGGGALAARRITLLRLALEAATCAQRDRFAEQPARLVAAAAAAAAAAADALVKQVNDPMLLTPGALDTVRLAQGSRALGFRVVRLASGRRHLADIKFGSPAHCAPALNDGDEIVQVSGQCVVGWQCGAVLARCAGAARAAAAGQLALGVCRRPPPTRSVWLPKKVTIPEPQVEAEVETEDAPLLEDPVESVVEQPVSALSSPAARMFPRAPRAALQRRHTVCVPRLRTARTLLQILEEIKEHRWLTGHSNLNVDIEDTLYRRDKSVSYSTGLELSPRPRTCMAMLPSSEARRGKLDKSHSTPAYDLDLTPADSSLLQQTIPESPTTPSDSPPVHLQTADKTDTILDFKKSSTQIGEAILQRHRRESYNQTDDSTEHSSSKEANEVSSKVVIECVNPVIREPPILKPKPLMPFPVLKAVPRIDVSPDYSRNAKLASSQLSLSLRQLSKEDIVVIRSEARAMPALNGDPDLPRSRNSSAAELSLTSPVEPDKAAHSPTSSMVRGIFPSSKTRSLKKKHSILAKRRDISYLTLWQLGAYCGGAWQRVRRPGLGGAGGGTPEGDSAPGGGARWLHRHLALLNSVLYAFASVESSRADCMVRLAGLTASLAGEVRSRAHAFKVYHTGSALYFACASHAAAAAWVRLVAAASDAAPPVPAAGDVSLQFSETDYSDTASDSENPERLTEPDRLPECKADHKDKSKFGSLKKLTHRMHKEPSDRGTSASLDRKYLRFFSRNKSKDEKLSKFQASRPSTTSLPPALHLSNPNLVASAPSRATPPPPASESFAPLAPTHSASSRTPDTTVGLLTLEQFMLKKQYEERAQLTHGGVSDRRAITAARQARASLLLVDVHGPGCLCQSRRSLRRRAPPPRYEKYSPEKSESGRSPAADTWRESLRRNDKVHDQTSPPPPAPVETTSGSRLRLLCAETRETAAPYRPSQLPVPSPLTSLQCSPLQYPPTFQPESYSLAHLAASRQRRH